MSKIDKSSRICIIGAGPGGLSTGYYLQKAGYKEVTILEKLPKVGGLCNSITYENRSFDLGANYLTPAYKKTLALAKEVDAELYTETKAYCYNPATKKFTTIFRAATRKSGFFSFAWQSLRYFYERWKVTKHLPEAGFAGVSQHPELTCTFDEWLVDKNLTALRELFHIPITLMGYGELNEIPAPYALTYMSILTFFSMLLFGSGIPCGWPKRFVYGFQRFWQKVSWSLTVINNVEIEKIERGDTVKINFKTTEHDMNKVVITEKEMTFDYLIVAVPLTLSITKDLFTDKKTNTCTLTKEEEHLFSKVTTNPYCMTTFVLDKIDLPRRLVNVLPVQKIGYPYVVTQQFEGNPLVSFYSRTNNADEPDRAEIIKEARELYNQFGSNYTGECYTHDRWTYFPHVPVLPIKEGFYDDLENMQGKNKTFFTGGLMAFELIEPIVNYSDCLVKKYFSE